MPRASKRKAAPASSSSVTAPPPDQSRSRTAKATSKTRLKESDQIDNLFDTYANSSLGQIDPEGIETLCSDMKVEYTDVRILMLAWKMKAQRQGYFTKDEWQAGMKALKANTLLKLVKALSELKKEAEAPQNFEDFYSFAFKYCLTEEKQKGVDIESTCELLKIVLGYQFRSQVDSLVEYLKVQKDYKVINKDQWMGFLRFCKEISFPDMANYDENQAWPLILDNFVDWKKQKSGGR
ncbi:unnamed protein product [Linum trigynum]|uniref:Defective in cullin neddylation protein n=1 Tax=Linum trigynum TaxID=586398 RepID=A0AAV2CRY3_9ROSI